MENNLMRHHYTGNKEQQHIKACSTAYHKRREFLWSLKSEPCTDCRKRFHPSAMDFDHLQDKTAAIAQFRSAKMCKLLAELAKCELVCSNCHRVRTFKRRLP